MKSHDNQIEKNIISEQSSLKKLQTLALTNKFLLLVIPLVLIVVVFLCIFVLIGYSLRSILDTIDGGPVSDTETVETFYPICTVTIEAGSCLYLLKYADFPDSERYGCLKDGDKVQVIGIADPYYEVSSYGLESAFMYEDTGALVTWVEEDGPAYVGGLQIEDIILRINDTALTDIPNVRGFLEQLVGQEVSFLIKRNGEEQTLFVTPREPLFQLGPTGFDFVRINSNFQDADRAFVLSYQVETTASGGVATMRSYVSCPVQMFQP